MSKNKTNHEANRFENWSNNYMNIARNKSHARSILKRLADGWNNGMGGN